MDHDLVVSEGVRIPAAELRWRFSRSGGPGGQHADTADTRVALSVDVAETRALSQEQRERAVSRLGGRLRSGVLTVTADDTRSQRRNRELVRRRLAAVLAEAIAPPARTRRPTRPSRRAREKQWVAKRHRSELKRTRTRPAASPE